jgi:hypothetical protein
MDKKSKCKIQVWWGIPAFSRQASHLHSILRAEIINTIEELATKDRNKKFFLRMYRWQGLCGGETRDENWT